MAFAIWTLETKLISVDSLAYIRRHPPGVFEPELTKGKS